MHFLVPLQASATAPPEATRPVTADDAVEAALKGLKSTAAVDAFVRVAPARLSTLRRLALASIDLSADNARKLAATLQHRGAPELRQLVVPGNRIGDRGAAAISEALAASSAPQLSMLNISNNRIGVSGARAIAMGLQRGTSLLRELYISGNRLNPEGARELAGALAHLPLLEQLHLVSNNIGVHGMKAIAEALPRLPRLTHMNIANNAGEAEGIEALANALNLCSRSCLIELQVRRLKCSPMKYLSSCACRPRRCTAIVLAPAHRVCLQTHCVACLA